MPARKKPSLLIVDPDVHLAEILAARFTKEGWTVRTAKHIDQAEKMLGRKASEVLLVDPSQEEELEERLVKLVDRSADAARKVILHTVDFSRKVTALWKRVHGDMMIRKGEQSLSEFVKKVKKHYGK